MNFIDTSNSDYPVTRADIETALPDVIWSDDNPPAPYAVVLSALSPPTPDADEVLVEGAPELVSGVWRQTWTVETKVVTLITPFQVIQQLIDNGGSVAAMQSLVDGSGDEGLKGWWAKPPAIIERTDPYVEVLRVLLATTGALEEFETQAGMDAFFLAASVW